MKAKFKIMLGKFQVQILAEIIFFTIKIFTNNIILLKFDELIPNICIILGVGLGLRFKSNSNRGTIYELKNVFKMYVKV